MTREAFNKLNDKQKTYCETLSVIINRARESGLKEEFERACGKLRGFLECLCQMEVIKGFEVRALYLWYFSEDRHTKSTSGKDDL